MITTGGIARNVQFSRILHLSNYFRDKIVII